MFHPTVIEVTLTKLADAFGIRPVEHSIDQVDDMVSRLAQAVDQKGNPNRQLTQEETAFILNERIMTKASYLYWAERYCFINREGVGIGRMFPFLESQQFINSRVAKLELDIHEGKRQDGILINLLKGARQVGGSTYAESVQAHRGTTQANQYGLIASDVPENSGYLFGMMEIMIDNLPWWLAPKVTDRVKNTEVAWETGSHVWVGAGKSTRGTEGKRGQLGRGKTPAVVHLSELSSWDTAEQIDGALIPGLPTSIRTFALFESTALGRRNWWHQHWIATRKGVGRFTNVYTPWYVEPKYNKIAPLDWQPNEVTLAHARRCEETSPRWIDRTVQLTRDQLYWYEFTRAYYETKGDLAAFLENYGSADDDECFQHSGHGVFGLDVVQRVQNQAKGLMAVLEVRPNTEIIR